MRSLLVVVALAACGDGSNHHLADAPPGVDVIPNIDGPPADVALHVTKDGTGTGTVSADGITCGATCDATVPPGTKLTLTAVADDSSTFTGWGGACTGTTPTCDVTVADATTVNATFALKTFAVTVTKSGAGTGTITGGTIACGSTCTATVYYGTQLTLTAAPANLSVFAGWGGACSGTTDCKVTVTADTDITANFALDDATLFVTLGGNGAGKVTSNPAGIDCGSTCQHTYSAGDMITLTATPSTGSTFTGWSGGGCTGTAACTTTLTTAATVTATFTLQMFALTVTKVGSGTVTGGGIACGATCTKNLDYGTAVTLTAAAASGFTFSGWSGACTGTGTCSLTMTAARNVTATFVANVTLTVAKSGSGAGTVTGGAINCGATCTQSVPPGTMITLTAAPDSALATASTFSGWSGGGCTGVGACTVTVSAATTVTAAFTLAPNVVFASSVLTTGNVNGLAGADKTCQSLADSVGLKGTFVAYLSQSTQTATIDAPSRVGNATGWVRTDGKPVMNAITGFQNGLFNPVLLDEKGNDTSASPIVWTGTNKAGMYQDECFGGTLAPIPWIGTSGSATIGFSTSTSATSISSDTTGCASQRRLYCLGSDRKAIAQ